MGTKEFFEESRTQICETVKSAARAQLKKLHVNRAPICTPSPKLDRRRGAGQTGTRTVRQNRIQILTEKVVVVGASTGGTEALREFLEAMPADCPGIVIVQHMPEMFTARFAERLNQLCRVTVKEAADGDTVIRGQALIAPGNRHLILNRSGARYFVEINDGPLVSRHRPSVDVLFPLRGPIWAAANVVGVIMTGMGDDGSTGMLEMKQARRDEFGSRMKIRVSYSECPPKAIKRGAVDRILP